MLNWRGVIFAKSYIWKTNNTTEKWSFNQPTAELRSRSVVSQNQHLKKKSPSLELFGTHEVSFYRQAKTSEAVTLGKQLLTKIETVIGLISLYILFFNVGPKPLSFHNLCVQLHVNWENTMLGSGLWMYPPAQLTSIAKRESTIPPPPLLHPQLGVCQTQVLGSTNFTLFLTQNTFRPEGFKTKPFRSAHTMYSFCWGVLPP